MPRGKAATAAAPAETGERDFTIYATKDLTATQIDFANWLRENVGDIDKMDADRVAALGPLCYHAFQASDFNAEQKAARAAERAEAEKARNAAKAAAPKPAATPKPTAPKTAAPKGGVTSSSSTSKPAATRGRQAPRTRATAKAGSAPF